MLRNAAIRIITGFPAESEPHDAHCMAAEKIRVCAKKVCSPAAHAGPSPRTRAAKIGRLVDRLVLRRHTALRTDFFAPDNPNGGGRAEGGTRIKTEIKKKIRHACKFSCEISLSAFICSVFGCFTSNVVFDFFGSRRPDVTQTLMNRGFDHGCQEESEEESCEEKGQKEGQKEVGFSHFFFLRDSTQERLRNRRERKVSL